MKPIVVIRRGADGHRLARSLLAEIGADAIVRGKSRVMVKPNITAAFPPETGVITSPSVVDGALAYLRDEGISDVLVAEGGGNDIGATFARFGFTDVVARYGVPLVDLNHDEIQTVKVPDPIAVDRFHIAKTVLECDCVISLPCLKVHGGEAVVTLCMKNMMGCVEPGRRAEMHQGFAEKIIDLLKVVRPDVNLIDGLVGRSCSEIRGEPMGMQVMLAGADCVATDAVGAAVMGLEDVPHILNAADHGLGVAAIADIEVRGESVASVRRPFPRRGWKASVFGAEAEQRGADSHA